MEVAVSGSRTQTSPEAAFLPTVAPAPAADSAATAATTKSRTVDLLEIFLTSNLLLLRG
jgi:hypothetical protein